MLTLAVASVAIGYLPTSLVFIGFMLVGVGNGLIDVYLNVAAQRAEVATRKPVLQWLHASYALGGVTGAAAAGLIIAAGLDFRWGPRVRERGAHRDHRVERADRSHRPRPAGHQHRLLDLRAVRTPALWVAALVVLFAFLVEGSMDTWSGLYLRDQLSASAATAAIAFIAFSGASSSAGSSRAACCSAGSALHDPGSGVRFRRRRDRGGDHQQPLGGFFFFFFFPVLRFSSAYCWEP